MAEERPRLTKEDQKKVLKGETVVKEKNGIRFYYRLRVDKRSKKSDNTRS